MSLSDAQLDRYARHIVLKEIGGEGQRKLLAAHVAVVGAGGIGSPAIQYLAAAGIGALRVIDDDVVTLDNLQRQILFGTADVGAAQDRGRRRGAWRGSIPTCASTGVAERLDRGQCRRAAGGRRRRRSTAATISRPGWSSPTPAPRARIPLVSAAIGQFQAQVGTFRGWEPDKPCYRCFVGDAFDAEDCDSCAELGVLGAMAGIAGSWAALEAIRQIVGFGGDPAGKLHIFDGLAPALRTIRIVKDPACSACGGDRAEAGSGAEQAQRFVEEAHRLARLGGEGQGEAGDEADRDEPPAQEPAEQGRPRAGAGASRGSLRTSSSACRASTHAFSAANSSSVRTPWSCSRASRSSAVRRSWTG